MNVNFGHYPVSFCLRGSRSCKSSETTKAESRENHVGAPAPSRTAPIDAGRETQWYCINSRAMARALRIPRCLLLPPSPGFQFRREGRNLFGTAGTQLSAGSRSFCAAALLSFRLSSPLSGRRVVSPYPRGIQRAKVREKIGQRPPGLIARAKGPLDQNCPSAEGPNHRKAGFGDTRETPKRQICSEPPPPPPTKKS